MRTFKTISTLTVMAGISLVALTGCSGGEQSVADACASANEEVAAVQSDLSTVSTDVASGDFTAVGENLSTLHSTLEEATANTGNAEVKEALGTLAEKVGDFADLFDGVGDGDLEALSAKADELQTTTEEVAEAGQAMSELCD